MVLPMPESSVTYRRAGVIAVVLVLALASAAAGYTLRGASNTEPSAPSDAERAWELARKACDRWNSAGPNDNPATLAGPDAVEAYRLDPRHKDLAELLANPLARFDAIQIKCAAVGKSTF